MIEVEKKFLLTKDDEKKLIEGADFIGEKVLFYLKEKKSAHYRALMEAWQMPEDKQ